MKSVQLAKDLILEKTDKKTGKCLLSKKKLGEILCQRYPTYFPTAESGRTSIRRVTGAFGKEASKEIKTRVEWKGLALPEPEKNDYSKFIIKESRIGILSDIHFPYYDKQALDVAIGYLRKWKPDCIILNGDIIDCYQISDFVKDGRKPKFKAEVEMVRLFIHKLKDLFPKVRIVWKLGNHEDRYEKRILQRAPEFLDLSWTTFEGMIKMEGIEGVEIVKGKRIIQAGKLNIIHGHELPHGIAAPVNPARGFFLRTKASTLGGHHHQSSDHSESDINGNITGAWSTGCLCDLHPDYMPVNKWNSGFATVENFGSEYTVKNHRIINGKVL